MIDIVKAKKAFDDFVSNYDALDERIKLKYDHTLRVCNLSKEISSSLNLNEEDTNLSYLIALLHDVGRFEQIKLYDTFNDLRSVDHALLGCNLLFDNGLIRNFIEDDKYDGLIKKAIYNHNKYSINDDCNDKELLHCKIIRDIDKLDIIYNVCYVGEIKLNKDDSKISTSIKNAFDNNLLANISDKKTKNDAVMIMFLFVFDLSFKYSFICYKNNNFINRMFDLLDNSVIFKDYVDKLNLYIERKCNDAKW